MENFDKLNLKVRIQILDANDQILLQSTVNQNDVNDLRVYQGVSLVDETYLMLLETLKQKIDSESITPSN
jgi:hypothetical protein